MARVVLKPGHVRPVHAGHPWVFQQAIARVEGGALAGDEVTVVDPSGRLMGRGLYSPKSAITVRLFTRQDLPIDGALIRKRVQRALKLRSEFGLPEKDVSDAYRLVHGEGDGLPGLIVDVFGDVVSVQMNTIGIKRLEGVVFDALAEALSPRAIVDRTSEAAARIEGVSAGQGVVRGDTKLSELEFWERGFRYKLPTTIGQKTGYYLDQRNLRARVEQLAKGRRVLDAYSFVGSFALAAARGGAEHVTAVDESAIALETGAVLARDHGYADRIEFSRGDAVAALETMSRSGGCDLVLCDPPKLAPSRSKRDAALTAYRRIARAACRATRPGGLLVMSSCSGAVGIEDLIRAIALGARDANLEAVVLERHFQAPDHPVLAAFPEGLYLKSVVLRVETLS